MLGITTVLVEEEERKILGLYIRGFTTEIPTLPLLTTQRDGHVTLKQTKCGFRCHSVTFCKFPLV